MADKTEVNVSLRMPNELHDAIATVALREGRSMHNQILFYLRKATEGETADPELLAAARRPGRKRGKRLDDETGDGLSSAPGAASKSQQEL